MARVKEHGDEELYNRLDSAYPSEDEDSEVNNLSYSEFHLWYNLYSCPGKQSKT